MKRYDTLEVSPGLQVTIRLSPSRIVKILVSERKWDGPQEDTLGRPIEIYSVIIRPKFAQFEV